MDYMIYLILGFSIVFNAMSILKVQRQEKILESCRTTFIALVKYNDGLSVPSYFLKSVKPCDSLVFEKTQDNMLSITLK